MEYKKYPQRIVRHWLAGPFIWLMLVPLVFLDICIEIYHRICFPLYGLAYVKRSNYIIFDRQKLSYLRWYDKIFCTYCAYANGLLPYSAAIAKETEKYWCGIKHMENKDYALAAQQQGYIEFGDNKAYQDLGPRNKFK